MNQNELLSLKEDITNAKIEVSKLEGKKAYLHQQLLDQFGCASIAEAESKSKKLEKSIAKLDEAIETATTELEEKYALTKEDEE